MTGKIRILADDGQISRIEIMEQDQLNTLLSRMFFLSPSLMAVNRFEDNVFLDVNYRFTRFIGYSREEIIGHSIPELNILSQEEIDGIYQSLEAMNAVYNKEIKYRTKAGKIRQAIYSAELVEIQGKKFVLSVYNDITESRHVQNVLKQKDAELTRRLEELEEARIALRVISEHRSKDRKNLEAVFQQNINELIIPYIREMRKFNPDKRNKQYLNIIESNLKDIVSPFLDKLSSRYKKLTPTEIQVASMVKEGMTSKNIAEILGVTVGTVDTHRNNIRKKLGLKKEKINLRSYLLSMS
jgi:PAS domain S-box-containing protein